LTLHPAWPTAGGSNNCLVVVAYGASGYGLGGISDDKSNSYTLQQTTTANSITTRLWTATGITASTYNINVSFTGSAGDSSGYAHLGGFAVELQNCGPIGGHAGGSFTSNGSAQSITLSATPSSGDAVLGFFLDTSSYTPDLSTAPSVGSGFSALANSKTYGKLSEIDTATTSTSIPVTFPNTGNTVIGVGIDIGEGSAGTSLTGMYIDHSQVEEATASTSQTYSFPCSGNLLLAVNTSPGSSISSGTTSGWTWTTPSALLDTTTYVSQIAEASGGTCSSSTSAAFTLSATPANPGTSILLLSVTGAAASSPLDTSNKSAGSQGTAANFNTGISVTPTALGELSVAVSAISWHTITGYAADSNSHTPLNLADVVNKDDDAESTCATSTPNSTLNEDNVYGIYLNASDMLAQTYIGTGTQTTGSCLSSPAGVGGYSVVVGVFKAAPTAGTYTAASCSYANVNGLINNTGGSQQHQAINGDTIIIPAGSCTWAAELVVPNNIGITIIGAGTPNSLPSQNGAASLTTIITDNTGGNPLIFGAPEYGNSTMRISMLDIEPGASSDWSPLDIGGVCASGGCPNLRIDNIGFGLTTQWTEGGGGSNDWMIRADNVVGVLDHNTLPNGSTVELFNASLSKYLGVGDYGDNSWAQPDTFGGAQVLYAENNIVYTNQAVNDCDVPAGGTSVNFGGCRIGPRYNQITLSSAGQAAFALTIVHGLDTGGRNRSGRQIEAYGNIVSLPGSLGYNNALVGFRGGTGYEWGNVVTKGASASLNQLMSRSVYRTVYAPTPWSYCGGLTSIDPFDTQDNTVYYSGVMTASGLTMTDSSKSFPTLSTAGDAYSVYDTTQGFMAIIVSNTSTTITVDTPISESSWTDFANGDSYEIVRAPVCADQAGRGAGGYISGNTPTPSGPLNQALDPIYEWNDSSPSVNFGVMAGTNVGNTIANRDYYIESLNQAFQTSATSPFNGTSGVGHGTLANRPTTCTTGVGYAEYSGSTFAQLDKCTSTNTWTNAIYTPYTYPHPLISGVVIKPGSPLNLLGTVSP
jgi:hypothetical protein